MIKFKEARARVPLINERIPASEMQLITDEGENIGVVSKSKALDMARTVGLDLVIIAEKGKDGIPVAKIMDFGKAAYAKKKKQLEAKKKQKVTQQIKEIKIRPKIGEHDYQTKMKRGIEFLKAGKRLKVTLEFRGREMMTRAERGQELFKKIQATFAEHGLADNLVQEKDSSMGRFWSRVYYVKGK